MPLAREPTTVSDLERDAERYRQLVRMLRAARSQLDKIEADNPDIDQILDRLLPDLMEALGAEQAFAAVLRQEANGDRYFEVTDAHPTPEACGTLIPWNTWLEDLVRTGRAFSWVPLEPEAQDMVPGLEPFAARSALVVRMQGARDTRIVGVCNEKDDDAGPFLASDCRVFDTIIQFVAIGLRVGERRSLELEGIQETSAAVSAELELERLLDLITERAAQVFRVPATSLMLWDDLDNLVIKAAYHVSDHYRRQLKIPRSRVEQRRKADGTYATQVIDLSRDALAPPELVASEGLHQVLSAPLWFSGELIGALNIYSEQASQRSSRVFTRDEMELAQVFADQAAIAVHNARLYQASRRQTLHWQALHEASKAIVEGFAANRRELLARIMEQAVQCVAGVDGPKVRLAFLQLYDPQRNVLAFECIYPPSVVADLTARLGQERILDRIQASGGRIGISGRAAKSGQSYLVRDIGNDPDYLAVDSSTRSELDVPLKDRGKVIGVLTIESDLRNAFDEDDRTTLEGLAAMAVIVIRNADQAKELERSNLVAVMGAWGAEIAHDAEEEVGAIRRAADILQNRMDVPEEAKAWLQEIDASAETLALPLLPSDPPAFGQAASQLDPAPLDDTLLSEVERLKRRYYDAEWLTDFNAPNVRVAMHHRWLRQLVRHLGRNAYQALPEVEAHGVGTIIVRTTVDGDMARIEIEDTGKGVRPEIRSLLFGVQVPHQDQRPPGRGLLLVSYLVRQHGGTVSLVRSDVGKGSCFALTIPVSPSQS